MHILLHKSAMKTTVTFKKERATNLLGTVLYIVGDAANTLASLLQLCSNSQ